MKTYREHSVFEAAQDRIRLVFDNFDRLYVAFSGGKDSTVMLHLVMEEAIKRGRKVGVLIIDLEAQYNDTIDHITATVEEYKEHIDLHWVCAQLLLRNAVSNFQPRWCAWEESKRDIWVREKPPLASDMAQYDFYVPRMEFEEFTALFGQWYGRGASCAAFIGIRAEESLNRYFAVSQTRTETFQGHKWTTRVTSDEGAGVSTYNVYPLYDWRTSDIWIYHARHPDRRHNRVYDLMTMAGVKPGEQRLCQPFGDEQRRGLWLYHVLEPETWRRLVVRVHGAASGARYSQEIGNVTGYSRITRPEGHTWESFCTLLLCSLPRKTREHYTARFRRYVVHWRARGYSVMPDEAPHELETGNRGSGWAPSWRAMCRVLLRNDYWCKGLGQAQPKSEAYLQFKEIRAKRKLERALS